VHPYEDMNADRERPAVFSRIGQVHGRPCRPAKFLIRSRLNSAMLLTSCYTSLHGGEGAAPMLRMT
jgi:hypothetical protein